MLVVLPETVAQVQALMRLCHRERIPVVPRGAVLGATLLVVNLIVYALVHHLLRR